MHSKPRLPAGASGHLHRGLRAGKPAVEALTADQPHSHRPVGIEANNVRLKDGDRAGKIGIQIDLAGHNLRYMTDKVCPVSGFDDTTAHDAGAPRG